MNDDEMDELLIQAARDYNEPAFVPREEMWSRISAAREEGERMQREIEDLRAGNLIAIHSAGAYG